MSLMQHMPLLMLCALPICTYNNKDAMHLTEISSSTCTYSNTHLNHLTAGFRASLKMQHNVHRDCKSS